MKEVSLINLPSPFLLDPMMMPPLGACYVASSLRSKGIRFDFVDLAKDPNKPIPKARCYAMGSTTPQFPYACGVLRKLKTRESKSRVILGGPHATLSPHEGLGEGFDAVIIGEGEEAIFDFLAGKNGILEKPIPDINSIPFPARDLMKDYKYTIDGKKSTTMITSRGNCPFNCAFCCKNWRTKMRFRSPENVFKEAEELKVLGYGGIHFYDDEFFLNRNRDFEICHGLGELGFIWRCFSRADLIDFRVADLASFTGCKEMLIGFESGSDTILKNIHKGTTVEQNKEAIEILHDYNIRVKAAMILGLPGESKETLKETWNFCEEVQPYISEWDFCTLVPYPSSPIYENPDRFDIKFKKGDIYNPYKGGEWRSIVSTSHLTKEEITEWREKFHRKFKGEVY